MEDGRLGKYEVRGTLGRGAVGTVYEGWDPIIARRVAIKTVRLPDASETEAQEELARFKREAQAAGRLNHPNIVGVFDYGETAELAYIVMEFIDGTTLKGLLEREERFPLAEIGRIMGELLAGLQFSHDRGVVHRDIKPANLMMTSAGQLKIADFGIARIESSSMTQVGTVMGTPTYMSPEQFMGQTVDPRTDIYAAGVVLYQLLTGERPFEGSMTAIMHKALNTQPPRPSQLSVTAPETLDAVVARAMGKRPEERYPSAAEFARAVREAIERPALPPAFASSDATMVAPPPANPRPPAAPAPATPAPATPAAAAPATRRWLSPLVLVGVLVVTIIGAGGWFLLRPVAPVKPPVREAEAPAAAPAATQPPPAPAAPPPAVTTTPAAPPALPVAPPPAEPPSPAMPPAAATPPPAVTAAPPPPPSSTALQPTQAPVAPVAPPAPPPAAAVPPPPDAAAIRAALATVLPGAPCSLVRAQVADPVAGGVVLDGLTGSGEAEAKLQAAVGQAAGGTPLHWRTHGFAGPYCDALEILRPVGSGVGAAPLSVTVQNPAGKLADGSMIVLDIRTPDFPSYLQVDYLSNDGSLAHFYPNAQAPAHGFPAATRLSLGEPDPRAGFAGWQVGPPYGTDMVIAVASSVPLFTKPRPADETLATYLRGLAAAMDRVRHGGGRLAAWAVTLDTVAR